MNAGFPFPLSTRQPPNWYLGIASVMSPCWIPFELKRPLGITHAVEILTLVPYKELEQKNFISSRMENNNH